MEPGVFAAVLVAAVLHAGWNAVVKLGLDRFSSVLLLALVQAAIALALVPFVAQPAAAALPWIAAAALLHIGYQVFLIHAYSYGDLSQIYPIARGTAPLLVAVVSLVALSEELSASALAAILTISGGVLLMSLKGNGLGRMTPTAVLLALGTACFTAGYTLVDGTGARVAGTASGFILWMFALNGAGMLVFAVCARGSAAFPAMLGAWKVGVAAGAMSLGSYWIAVWAFTQAPIALVAALRETSIIFVVLLGALFLGERADRWRWASAALIALGVVFVRL